MTALILSHRFLLTSNTTSTYNLTAEGECASPAYRSAVCAAAAVLSVRSSRSPQVPMPWNAAAPVPQRREIPALRLASDSESLPGSPTLANRRGCIEDVLTSDTS